MTGPASAAQLAELQAWCLGSAGRGAASVSLRRVGLPSGPQAVEDVCQETFVKVWERLRRGPLVADGDGDSGVVPYATVVSRNVARDWLRRTRRERLDGLLHDDVPADDPVGDDPIDPGVALAGLGLFALDGAGGALRRILADHLAERPRRLEPWTISAVLVMLQLTAHPDLALLPGVPVPDPRSPAKHDGGRWAGLAYAGRADCFTQPETGAVRQRRSVARQRIDATLRSAVEAVTSDVEAGS
jgi:DNA-directed RNA polymerase specialized sigma24 family protein